MPHRKGFEELLRKSLTVERDYHGIEIGCYFGEFAKHLLNAFPSLYLTTVEPYTQYDRIFGNNACFLNRLNIVPLKSDWACDVIKGEFDFVFIDGDHSYEQCRKDIVNYLKFVKHGGIFAGHNYHKHKDSAHPGVHQAVDEIFGDKVKLQEDFIWYVEI